MGDNTQEEFEQFLTQNKIDFASLKQAQPNAFNSDIKKQRTLGILKAVILSYLFLLQTNFTLEN